MMMMENLTPWLPSLADKPTCDRARPSATVDWDVVLASWSTRITIDVTEVNGWQANALATQLNCCAIKQTHDA